MSTGVLRKRFPYVRFGDGPPVVVLPGMTLRNQTPGRMLEAGYRQAFKALAADHTVHFIGARAAWVRAPPPATSRRSTRPCSTTWARST